MGMKSTVLLLASVLFPLTVDAQSGSGGRFEACVWPNRCGPGPKNPVAPKPEPAPVPPEAPKEPPKQGPKALPNLTMPTDPLSQAILQRQLAGEQGIVSAVRLKKEHTGWSEDQIVYHGNPDLRDALRPAASPDLPPSAIPKPKRDAKEAGKEKGEWKKIDPTGAAAKQINCMTDDRPALSGTQTESKEGVDRMWGDKTKRADK